MPQDMKKCQTYAGRRILFEQEEVTEMKKFDVSGLAFMNLPPYSTLVFCHTFVINVIDWLLMA